MLVALLYEEAYSYILIFLISLFVFHFPWMPRTTVSFSAPALHAPTSNESDEQVWKVSLHYLRLFGSILNIRAAAAVHYMELQ